jgi:two-component system, cell cycle sensor histidine kinase and response regulator CckA
VSMAREALPDDSPMRKRLEPIESVIKSATELTQQLQICAGKNPAVAVPCRLDAILAEIKQSLGSSLPARIALSVSTSPDLAGVLADPAQLKMLCLNLVANAREAIAEKKGTISLRAAPVEGANPPRICLEVEDDGCGMHEETRLRAFDPFFSTRSPERGLGLAVVLGIAQSFQGDVSLMSAPGKGTTVKVTLAAAPPSARDRNAAPASKGCILVAEDDTAIRELMGRALGSAGFTVLLAKDGDEALAIYRNQPDKIDLVVLDMWMPGMSGELLFQELRAIRANVRGILASGSLDRGTVDKLTKLGLAGVIQKPYQPFALVEKVIDLLPARV